MLKLIAAILYALFFVGTLLIVIFDDGDSGRKVAWLLVITLFPVVGLVLYYLIGINYRHHWYFEKMHQRSIDAFAAGTTPGISALLFGRQAACKVDPRFAPLAELLGTAPSTAVTDGNDIEIISSGARKYELLTEDLRNARESIHIEYFLFGEDKGSREIKRLLMQKAGEGVKVRFIYENVANFPHSPFYYSDMRKAGVEVVKFTNPRNHILNFITTLNYRNHRKIVVIDGKTGYTGGMNIGDKYFRVWRDTHLRLTGKAVAVLQYIFLDSWITAKGTLDREFREYFPQAEAATESTAIGPVEAEADGSEVGSVETEAEVQKGGKPEERAGGMRGGSGLEAEVAAEEAAGGPSHPLLRDRLVQIVPDEPDSKWPLIQMSYEWMLANARRYVYLQTPYFVPPETVLNALKSASLRGVDVRLMLPAKADSFFMGPANKAYFEECLKAGIKIYQKKGAFIHSKTFVTDDYLSCIGTANMDFRSFNINYEVNSYLYDAEAAALNKALFLKDLEECEEVNPEEWRNRRWYHFLIQNLLRLFAPLL